jgi:hypothetical protein
MRRGMQRVPTTRNWVLPDEQGMTPRQIVVRDPRLGEPDGTKYEVTGKEHGHTVHSSMEDAKTAAEASLR